MCLAFSSSLDISASALTAERFRMDVTPENMANSSTTRMENGGSYCRKFAVPQMQGEDQSRFRRIFQNQLQQVGRGAQVAQVAEDSSDLTPVHDPTHSDTNADGYVMMSNVDPVKETADMMAATRAYEANLTMFNAVENMAVKALEMGRQIIMMIVPIQPIQLLDELNRTTRAVGQAELSFQSLLQDAVNDVKETGQVVQDEVYKLATGQSDGLHNIMIASQKAIMSAQLSVQLRDEVLDAYNEVMRMSAQVSDFFVVSLLYLSGKVSVRVNHE